MKLTHLSKLGTVALVLALSSAVALAQPTPITSGSHQATAHDHTPVAHDRTPVARR